MLLAGALAGCGSATVPGDGDDDQPGADADADADADAEAEAGTPEDVDPCLALCGNGVLDCREECDDGSNLLVADTNGNAIRTFNLSTNCVGTLAGDGNCGYLDGPTGFLRVNRVRGMASDGSSLYWAEQNGHTIRQLVFATGEATTMIGSVPTSCVVLCSCGTTTPPGAYAEDVGAAAKLDTPFGMTYDIASGDLFFVDSGNRLVRRVH